MYFSEFITYIEAYFLKKLEDVFVKFVMQAAEFYLLNQTRGILDNQMTGWANNLNIACPACKHVGGWVSAPEEIKQEQNKKSLQP